MGGIRRPKIQSSFFNYLCSFFFLFLNEQFVTRLARTFKKKINIVLVVLGHVRNRRLRVWRRWRINKYLQLLAYVVRVRQQLLKAFGNFALLLFRKHLRPLLGSQRVQDIQSPDGKSRSTATRKVWFDGSKNSGEHQFQCAAITQEDFNLVARWFKNTM